MLSGQTNRLAEIAVPSLVVREKTVSLLLLAFAGAGVIVELLVPRANDVHWAYSLTLLTGTCFLIPSSRNSTLGSATADAFGLLWTPMLLRRTRFIRKRDVDHLVNTST